MAISKANLGAKSAATVRKSAAPDAGNAAPSTGTGRLPSMREIQEQKLKERRDKLQAATDKVLEQRKLKAERQAKLRQEAEARQRRSMITFVIGLFIMLTLLIYFFQNTTMIIFSTLLMFTFFFLGIAYQRMVMQLLVVAIACVGITAAFYTIMSSM